MVNHLALFVDDGLDCMEGMVFDASILDDRMGIVEGNAVVLDCHSLMAVTAETLVAFDLNHLQLLVLCHLVVSSMVVSLVTKKLKSNK